MKIFQENALLLRFVLLANGAFSGVSGLYALWQPGIVSNFVFVEQELLWGIAADLIISLIGGGLALYAVILLWSARQEIISQALVRIFILADMFWVVLTGILIAFAGAILSPSGVVLLLVLAAIVFLLGGGQALGLSLLYQGESKMWRQMTGNSLRLIASRVTKAERQCAWQVISDMEGYSDVAENLSKVEVLSGRGEGMVRQCFDMKSQSWKETCTSWQDGHSFSFKVDTLARNYPYPFAELDGKWMVESLPEGENHKTLVAMEFNIVMKPGLKYRLVMLLMAPAFMKVCDLLLMRWVKRMENKLAY